MNKIKLQGVIVGEIIPKNDERGNHFYMANVEALRMNGTTKDIVPVLVPQRAIKGVELKVGERVTIEGKIRTGWNKEGVQKMNVYVYVSSLKATNEAEDHNDLELKGHICKKPVYRKTPKGYEVTDVIIAVDGRYDSYYIPLVFWMNNANKVKTLKVGDEISIEGTFHHRMYSKTFKDGTTRELKAHEISVNRFEPTGNSNLKEGCIA